MLLFVPLFAIMLFFFFLFFFFNDTATTEIYTLSLHDALPISGFDFPAEFSFWLPLARTGELLRRGSVPGGVGLDRKSTRLNSSHPSISYAVFCLKKKKKIFNSELNGITVMTRTRHNVIIDSTE